MLLSFTSLTSAIEVDNILCIRVCHDYIRKLVSINVTNFNMIGPVSFITKVLLLTLKSLGFYTLISETILMTRVLPAKSDSLII